MFKSVQFKIIFIITLFTLLFIAYILVEKSGDKNAEVQSLFKLRESEKNELFDRLVKLQGSPLEIFAYDYTFWDEMVNFVSSRDTTWAFKEVSSGLSNYNVNFVWIYDADDSLIYSFNTLDRPDYKKSPFGKVELKKIFGEKRYFSHFFMNMDTCLIEIRVAPIQPSVDLGKKIGTKRKIRCCQVMESVAPKGFK